MNPADEKSETAQGVLILAGIFAVGVGIVTKNFGWGLIGFVVSGLLIAYLSDKL